MAKPGADQLHHTCCVLGLIGLGFFLINSLKWVPVSIKLKLWFKFGWFIEKVQTERVVLLKIYEFSVQGTKWLINSGIRLIDYK